MNQKFYLAFSKILQGDLDPQDLNLMLVFQVNCPGCFVSGFPFANYLQKQFGSKGLKVLGLATAFEDYEFNTVENTERLVNDGIFVGETKKVMNSNGYDELPYPLDFAIGFDDLQPMKGQEITEEVVEKMCQTLPDYLGLNFTEKKLVRGQVKEYLLNKKFSAATFDTNDLRGTPSWVLYDKDYQIYGKWFGHQFHSEIETTIKKLLEVS